LFTITGGAVGGACGVRPLVVRSWPGEHNGIRTPKHAAQRTDEPQWVAGVVCRMHAVKMARVIFMASRYDLISIDPVNTADFKHYSYQFCPLTYLMFSRTPPEFGVFSFELPPGEFSLGACSVRALTCMKAK
jgi:hypothetical protein